MSTDYRTYKEPLQFSKILEIEKSLEGFTVVISENPQDVWGIRYQGNFLAIFLSDDRQIVELLTRYGMNEVGEIISIISSFTNIPLYDEQEYMAFVDRKLSETILIVHFTENEKSIGLDFSKTLQKNPKCIDGSSFNGDIKNLLKYLIRYNVPNLWFENLEKIGGKEAFLQEVRNLWENCEFELFIYNGDEEIKIPVTIPVERAKFIFTPSEEDLNIYFDEELHKLNGNLFDHKYSNEIDRDDLKLSIEACQAIVEGCENGKKWVNDNYLYELAKGEKQKAPHYFFAAASYLWQYEEFVVERCQSGIEEFREKNPGMKTFCDFFERKLLQFYNVTAESDQVTSN